MPQVHPDLLRSGDAAAIQAAEALIKALTVPDWPENQINLRLPMTRKTLAALEQQRAISEVDRYLTELAENDWRTHSRQWHYFRYKYVYRDDLQEASELDNRFDAVLQDRNAQVYYPNTRYIVYSPQEDRWAIFEKDGKRISVYRPRPEELKNLGDPLWPIQVLID